MTPYRAQGEDEDDWEEDDADLDDDQDSDEEAVSGHCSCGYESKWLSVGVGMRDPRGKWLAPCLCRKCHQAVSANVRAKTLKCPKGKATGIEPYVDPDAGTEEGEEYPSCVASEPLFDSRFECPACGKKSLKFEFAGMWD